MTEDSVPENPKAEEGPNPGPPETVPAGLEEEGDEPRVERAETLRLSFKSWLVLWGIPIVVAVVLLAILIALTNP